MKEDERDLPEQSHKHIREQRQEDTEEGHKLVQVLFREAVERQQAQAQRQRSLVEQLHPDTIEQGHVQMPPPLEPATIPYTDLPEGSADSPIASEWNFYRRQVGQLLADGHENRWVLIKGEHIVGIWATREEAKATALQRYFMQPCLIQQIRRREPLVRTSLRFWQCQG